MANEFCSELSALVAAVMPYLEAMALERPEVDPGVVNEPAARLDLRG